MSTHDSPLDVGDTLNVTRDTDGDTRYPSTIVGGLVVDIDENNYHTIWYYNDRGEVVAGRELSRGRVTTNLDANDGDWCVVTNDDAPENHGYIQIPMNNPDSLDIDVDTALDAIEADLGIRQRDDYLWAIGPRPSGKTPPDKLYNGTWREAQEYCRRADDDLQVYNRVDPVTEGTQNALAQ